MFKMSRKVLAGESLSREIDTDVFPDLVKVITEFDGKNCGKLNKDISKLLSDTCRGNIQLKIVDQPGVMAIEVPDVSLVHPLVNKYKEHYLSGKDGVSTLYKANKALGGYNPNTGFLSGELSRLPGIIHVSKEFILGKVTVIDEVASFILHELGHHLSYIFALGNTIKSAGLMDAGAISLMKEKQRSKRITMVKEYGKQYGTDVSGEEALAIADIDSSGDISLTLNILSTQNLRNQYGANLYDLSVFETMADLYASRLGAGEALGRGLINLHKAHYSTDTMKTHWYLIVELFSTLLTIYQFTSILGIISVTIMADMHYRASSSYPTLDKRVENLILEAQGSLSSSRLSDGRKDKLLLDIEKLKEVRKEVKRDDVLRNRIYKWLITSKHDRSLKETVLNLERISNNEFFAVAHRANQKLNK